MEFKKEEYNKPPYSIKILVFGDTGAGKTSLIREFTHTTTLDLLFLDSRIKHTIEINKNKTDLYLFESHGPFSSFSTHSRENRNMYSGDCIIFVYDTTKIDSYNNISNWHKKAMSSAHIPDDTPIILVGTKADLPHRKQISDSEAQNFAQKQGFQFFLTSTKNQESIQKLFNQAVDTIFHEKRLREIQQLIDLIAQTQIRIDLPRDKLIQFCEKQIPLLKAQIETVEIIYSNIQESQEVTKKKLNRINIVLAKLMDVIQAEINKSLWGFFAPTALKDALKDTEGLQLKTQSIPLKEKTTAIAISKTSETSSQTSIPKPEEVKVTPQFLPVTHSPVQESSYSRNNKQFSASSVSSSHSKSFSSQIVAPHDDSTQEDWSLWQRKFSVSTQVLSSLKQTVHASKATIELDALLEHVSHLKSQVTLVTKQQQNLDRILQQDVHSKAQLQYISDNTELDNYYRIMRRISCHFAAAQVIKTDRIAQTDDNMDLMITGVATLGNSIPGVNLVTGLITELAKSGNEFKKTKAMYTLAEWAPDTSTGDKLAELFARYLTLAKAAEIKALKQAVELSNSTLAGRVCNALERASYFGQELKENRKFTAEERMGLVDTVAILEAMLTRKIKPAATSGEKQIKDNLSLMLQVFSVSTENAKLPKQIDRAEVIKAISKPVVEKNITLDLDRNHNHVAAELEDQPTLVASHQTTAVNSSVVKQPLEPSNSPRVDHEETIQDLRKRLAVLEEKESQRTGPSHAQVSVGGGGQMQAQLSSSSYENAAQAEKLALEKQLVEQGKQIQELQMILQFLPKDFLSQFKPKAETPENSATREQLFRLS